MMEEIKKKMLNYAKDLQFEKAALLRDKLEKLKNDLNILLLGSGGREHSIAWALSKDKRVKKSFCAPGNAGISSIAKSVSINILDNDLLYDFVIKNSINLVVVGPEQPLENGVVNYFNDKGIKIFGPNEYASQLETSKLFARYIMDQTNIPQPAFFECNDELEIFIEKIN